MSDDTREISVNASVEGEKEARDYTHISYVQPGTVPYWVRQRIARDARHASHDETTFQAEVEKRTAAWKAQAETR